MLKKAFSEQFRNMISCSDTTIILTSLVPIKAETDPSSTIWDVIDDYSGLRWIEFCEARATEEIEFESIWDKEKKIYQLVFSYPDFNPSSNYQCIYIRFSCGGIENEGGIVIANDTRVDWLNLCNGYNQFTIDFSSYPVNNISTSIPASLNDKIREGVGKDPEKYFLKTRIWEKKVFSLFSFCILQLMLDSNYFLSI